MKGIARFLLLGFVLATLGYLTWSEFERPAQRESGEDVVAVDAPQGEHVVVYYFHSPVRCVKCRKMELLAMEVLEERFSEDTSSRRVIWKALDYQAPQNAPLAELFELTSSSLVLAKYDGADLREWNNLTLIWQLVNEDERYKDYVADELHHLLESKDGE